MLYSYSLNLGTQLLICHLHQVNTGISFANLLIELAYQINLRGIFFRRFPLGCSTKLQRSFHLLRLLSNFNLLLCFL